MIEKIFDGDNLRMALGIGMILIAFGVIFGVISAPVAGTDLEAGGNETTVHLDDPANESVEIDVNYSEPVSATATLSGTDGTEITSETITGTADETSTFSLSSEVITSGDYVIDVSTAYDGGNVTVEQTRHIANRSIYVDDAGNQTVVVDVEYEGDTDASTEVRSLDEYGNEVSIDTISFDATANESIQTREYNGSDGVADGPQTIQTVTSAAAEWQSSYATVESEDDTGIIGGGIVDGMDQTTQIVVLVLIAGGALLIWREK